MPLNNKMTMSDIVNGVVQRKLDSAQAKSVRQSIASQFSNEGLVAPIRVDGEDSESEKLVEAVVSQ